MKHHVYILVWVPEYDDVVELMKLVPGASAEQQVIHATLFDDFGDHDFHGPDDIGLWCIGAMHVPDSKGGRLVKIPTGPAPEWRRLTVDELLQLTAGQATPEVVAWVREPVSEAQGSLDLGGA
jgi:hypothetical protein